MLNKEQLKHLLDLGLETGADFSELYFENTYSNVMEMTLGKVSNVTSNIIHGVAVRLLKGTEEVYAYNNKTSYEEVEKLVKKAASSFNENRVINAKELEEVEYENLTPVEVSPNKVDNDEKKKYLLDATNGAISVGEDIKQVICNFTDVEQKVLIVNSNGVYAEDTRTNCRASVSVVAQNGNKTQTANNNTGRNMGMEFFRTIDFYNFGKDVAEVAKTMLYADECKSGKMTVVVHNKFGGVLLHEACVHSLEATSVAKGLSVFANKIGEKIASDVVTAVDDGTLKNYWGSLNVDDEGQKTQRNVLIENGVLKSYLVDYKNSKIMNHPVTGSGRRQSYKYSPTSRMTNTFFENGKSTFEEIIAATEYGLFAKKMGGGSVNPITGEFNFNVQEGYLIENGKITKPVRGCTLVGSGAEVLMNIDMIGNNLSTGHGMCGSASGSIPTDVGQPTIRVQNMTVGGRG